MKSKIVKNINQCKNILRDIPYLTYYITRNFFFIVISKLPFSLLLVNFLLSKNKDERRQKIVEQFQLLSSNFLDIEKFDLIINYGSGTTSFKEYFPKIQYHDYDKYIQKNSSKVLFYSNKNKRTLVVSISAFQHIIDFENSLNELLQLNVLEIRAVIDCQLKVYPKCTNRELVKGIHKLSIIKFLGTDIFTSEKSIYYYIDRFLEKGFQVKELRFIDKFYNKLEEDTSNIYYIIFVKVT